MEKYRIIKEEGLFWMQIKDPYVFLDPDIEHWRSLGCTFTLLGAKLKIKKIINKKPLKIYKVYDEKGNKINKKDD